MISEQFYKLNNGVRIPKVALGTWQIPNEVVAEVVAAAIECGYRHIDTAIAYGNEAGVGEGIKAGLSTVGLHRENIFVTSKIPAEVKTYEEAVKCIEESLARLDSSYIDMMLIHAPKPWCEMKDTKGFSYFYENLQVWRALEEAYEAGKLRAIGVSNFDIDDLKNIMDGGHVKPAVDQVRVHIGHVPINVVDFCEQNGILIEAYSPNATGRLLHVPEVEMMATKYGVSVPQLASRFVLQLGFLPLPKSTHVERIRENLDLDFEINSADMADLLLIAEEFF